MTVNTTTSRVTYAGNGTTTTFTVPFYFLAASDLVVIKTSNTGTQTTLVLNTDYTVSGAGVPAGGTVTCTVAPTSSESLVIFRAPAETQLTDYQPNDPFPAETHERALDKLTMIAQRMKDLINRSFRLSDGDTTTASTQLPTPIANNVIGWNATATGLQNVTPQTLATIVSTGTTYADIFTGNGTQTNFTLTNNPANQANLDVSVGGVTQLPGTDYTWTSGTTLTFTSAPPNGAKILARYAQALAQQTGDAAAITFQPAGTVLTRTVQTKLREMYLSPEDFGASQTVSPTVSDLPFLNLCFDAAVQQQRPVLLLRRYNVDDVLEIPYRVVVHGVTPWSSGISPTDTWAPTTETYMVKVKQNPGGAQSDFNFFTEWANFYIIARKRNNLGCLDFNAGAGSSLNTVYILDGGTGAEQVRWSSAGSPGGGATVGQGWKHVFVGTSDGNPVCRNGVVFSGSGYSLNVDNCVFDYLSTGVSGTNGFALKLNGAGIVFNAVDMEGNQSPIYSNSSSCTFIGGSIRRVGLGSAPSTNPDFAIEVASNRNNMPNLIGTVIHQGYDSASGGGVAKINGGSSLNIRISSNRQLNYFNTRAFTADSGISLGNQASSESTVLDWYEEGTFTPTIIGVTTAGTGTYTTQDGFFTRMGNRVHFNLRVQWSAHTGTGAMRISGLPYTPSGTRNDSVVNVMADGLTYSNQLVGAIFTGANVIRLYQQATGAAIGSGTELPMDTAATLWVSGTYSVSI